MKKLFFFITLFSFLIGCNIKQKPLLHHLSTFENMETLPIGKEDSAKILKVKLSAEKSLEKCKKNYGTNCIDDIEILSREVQFLGGINKFRKILFEKFKVPKNAKEGENRVRITIGTQNDLEKVEILRYTDKNTKKAIENVFKLKELNTWKSAKIYGIPVKEQFEISIFIK